MAEYLKEDIEMLMDGTMAWPAVQEMMRESKDTDRFDKYVEVLQERVEFKDPILLPLTPALFIVAKNKDRVVKCRCGYDFGDYRINWKVSALIYVRDTAESIEEVFKGREMPDPEWCQIREYICPGCGTQLEVEAVPRGCPPDFDFLPDLDTFYDEWLGRPLRKRFKYEDKTLTEVGQWEERNYNKPIPKLSGLAKEFYRFCRKGQLRFQRCKDCDTWRHVPREMCPECGSFKWSWERSGGKGTIFSWVVADRALHPQFYDETPYAATVVEMDEGVRLLTEIVDCEPEDLEIGARVEVVFDEATNKVTLPKFRLVEATSVKRAATAKRAALVKPAAAAKAAPAKAAAAKAAAAKAPTKNGSSGRAAAAKNGSSGKGAAAKRDRSTSS